MCETHDMSYYVTGGLYDRYPDQDSIKAFINSAAAEQERRSPETIVREDFEWCQMFVRDIMQVENNKDIKWTSENERRLRTLFVFFLLERFKKRQISEMLNIPGPYLYNVDMPRIKKAAVSVGLVKKEDLSQKHNFDSGEY